MSSRHERSSLPELGRLTDLETRLVGLIEFVLSADKLKSVRRRNPLIDGARRERTAEHCWHVAFAAMCLHEHAAEEVDVGRAVQLAIVHDLPESVVGDTFVYGSGVEGRRGREEGALHALLAEVSGDVGSEIMRAWLEYEYETTPEGRYVMALDVLLPVFMNFVAGPDSSWSRFGITAGDVRRRVNHVRSVTPALADLALRVIDEAAERGLLREGGSA